MKLVYRGIAYSQSSTTIETEETEEIAKFLGKNYQVRRPIYQVKKTKLNLVYRGVSYSTNGNFEATKETKKKEQKEESIFLTKLKKQLKLSF